MRECRQSWVFFNSIMKCLRLTMMSVKCWKQPKEKEQTQMGVYPVFIYIYCLNKKKLFFFFGGGLVIICTWPEDTRLAEQMI